MTSAHRLHPMSKCSAVSQSRRLLLAAVIPFIILYPSTASSSLTAHFDGPETATPASTVSFECSWESDDIVFRILWRIQSLLNNNTLEYILKGYGDKIPIPLSSNPLSDLQGDLRVDVDSRTSVLTIRNVSFAAEGNYTCSISSVSAEKQLARSFRVIAPPDQIISRLSVSSDNTTFLEDGAVIGPYYEGTEFELNCYVAYSRPPATLKWLRVNQEGQSFSLENQSGLQKQQMDPSGVWRVNRALSFRLDSRDLMGNVLICQAENEASIHPVQVSYRLDLLVPPVNISLSKPLQLKEWTTYNITCETWDARPHALLTWALDGEPVARFIRTDIIPMATGGAITRSMYTYSANPDDNGKVLSCNATQEVLSKQGRIMSDSMVLNIAYSPRNVMTSRSQLSLIEFLRPETDAAGGINCTADANPPAHFVWIHNMMVISSEPTLYFNRNITRDDAGEYLCIATNEVGRTNISLQVDVHYRPFCTRCANASNPCLIGIGTGQQQSVRCSMDANPLKELTYTWNASSTDKTDDIVGDADVEPADAAASSSLSSLLSMTSSAINYTVRSAYDYRRLQCWSKNHVGVSHTPCYYRIVPAGPPHPPENCSIIAVMASGFTIKCKPGFDGGYPQKFLLSVLAGSGNMVATGGGMSNDDVPQARSINSAAAPNAQKTRQFQNVVLEPKEVTVPEWLEKGLSAGRDYQVEIMAKNEKGFSQPVYLPLKTLQTEDKPPVLSTTLIAVIAGSLGGFALLALVATIAFLCIRKKKKGDSSAAVSETHSNNSSSSGSKSELVKEAQQNGKHPDLAGEKKEGTKVSSLRFQRNGSTKGEVANTDSTYTRALDLGKKPYKATDHRQSDGIIYANLALTKLPSASQPAVAPKPPLSASLLNGTRPSDRTQYAVIDVTKQQKRAAPRPDAEMLAQEQEADRTGQIVDKPSSTNGSALHNGDGVIRTVAVV
ncbi:contactin-3-like isoform X2 [Paramacrobiotus metropolitanus]|uniref:contactin-3-like isoform X2 n=1 Tax=Paramacrobiotus metropolitanus TaxID=2943436 RepID=UPI002445C505|nr:contactin-3-like isoform X2 [Paramacrobiotus metropolitanus]